MYDKEISEARSRSRSRLLEFQLGRIIGLTLEESSKMSRIGQNPVSAMAVLKSNKTLAAVQEVAVNKEHTWLVLWRASAKSIVSEFINTCHQLL